MKTRDKNKRNNSVIKPVILFLIILSQTNFAQWQLLNYSTDSDLMSVCFTESQKAFITCKDGRLIRSEDGGNNWHEQSITSSALNSITFAEGIVGYVVGDSGRIFKSELQDTLWEDISIDNYFHIKDVEFDDLENGVIIGTKEVRIDGKTYFLPSLYVTINGGEFWAETQIDERGKLNSVSYLAEGVIIAVGDSGRAYRSIDNGNTWIKESLQTNANLNSVSMCPNYTAIICGDDGQFFFSYDLGESWNSMSVPEYYNFKGACFAANDIIVTAGNMEVRIDGKKYYMATILKFNLSNNQWSQELSQIRGTYNSISYCDPTLAIAAGDSGVIAVYGIETGINHENYLQLTNFNLYQNYPNPFNPTTVIKYSIPKESFVTVKVFDVLGCEVITLVNGEKPIGNYEFEFNGTDLPSGVYFNRLRAGSFIETKKMILLK